MLEAKLALADDDRVAINRLLKAEDPELVLLALEWVHRRRDPAFADAVASLVDHDDDRVVSLAVDCLGRVGTAQHVDTLLRSARLAQRDHAFRLYEALAGLGGDQARGFLLFAARNEDDPALAEAARRALERIDRRPSPGRGAPQAVARGHRR